MAVSGPTVRSSVFGCACSSFVGIILTRGAWLTHGLPCNCSTAAAFNLTAWQHSSFGHVHSLRSNTTPRTLLRNSPQMPGALPPHLRRKLAVALPHPARLRRHLWRSIPRVHERLLQSSAWAQRSLRLLRSIFSARGLESSASMSGISARGALTVSEVPRCSGTLCTAPPFIPNLGRALIESNTIRSPAMQ